MVGDVAHVSCLQSTHSLEGWRLRFLFGIALMDSHCVMCSCAGCRRFPRMSPGSEALRLARPLGGDCTSCRAGGSSTALGLLPVMRSWAAEEGGSERRRNGACDASTSPCASAVEAAGACEETIKLKSAHTFPRTHTRKFQRPPPPGELVCCNFTLTCASSA